LIELNNLSLPVKFSSGIGDLIMNPGFPIPGSGGNKQSLTPQLSIFNDQLLRYTLDWRNHKREQIIIPKNMGPVTVKTKEEKMVEAAFESCAFKSVMACVVGKWISLLFHV
jgi:hypothetical protein